MRGACGQAENQRDEIPTDGTEEASEEHLLGNHLNVNHTLADGAGHSGAEEKSGDEASARAPSYLHRRARHPTCKAREEQAQETKEFRGLDRVLESSAKPAKQQETGRVRRPKS